MIVDSDSGVLRVWLRENMYYNNKHPTRTTRPLQHLMFMQRKQPFFEIRNLTEKFGNSNLSLKLFTIHPSTIPS